MDLTQSKLSKREWETIEIPVDAQEKKILSMIIQGFHDVNIRHNETHSLYSHIKIEPSPEMDHFLFKRYFEEVVCGAIAKYGKGTPLQSLNFKSKLGGKELKSLKSADSIRVQNLENTIQLNRQFIFEFLLIDLCKDLIKQIAKQKQKYSFYLYTLIQLKKASIRNINEYVAMFIDSAILYANSITKTSEIISNAYEFIECNKYLLKYEDRVLFPHQKELYRICKNKDSPKLILYTAPTGTGKTLSPLGLSESYRIIFVCVARHIGLALAKSAISIEKKVAFAFGCESAADVRLHYFSALEYTKNRRSGGIGKVDNSVGDNVEIMICDVQSYITAMHYMLAFNEPTDIITYWDEPTITMDYETHVLHEKIHKNWTENKIPTMVLSCATLPEFSDIQPVFDDFREKFDGAEVHTITSFDCKKSIPILNKDGYCVLPHVMHSEHKDMIECAKYCEKNKTLLRYFDLREIIRFIKYVNEHNLVGEIYLIDSYFSGNIADITMNGLKEYYLNLLIHIDSSKWPTIYNYMSLNKKRKYNAAEQTVFSKSKSVEQSKSIAGSALSRTNSVAIPIKSQMQTQSQTQTSSGILLTTSDSYTLTDGPTIFLADDVSKIGNFYVQQSNIAPSVFQNILMKITKNAEIIKRMEELESTISEQESKTVMVNDGKKTEQKTGDARESGRLCKESQSMMDEINKLRKEIRLVSLDAMYVPNTKPHQQIWSPDGEIHENAFVSNIGEDNAKRIMLLNIENHFKVLLLLGIGMFIDNLHVEYMEIMKQLAEQQRLFIIIASTDYIYGTNYQFCHGFIGKDLTNMTQQKTMQAMGRIGRNNIQQDYTIRFRDDSMIERLFKKPEVNLEARNMLKLFST
jgi:hypothetical protein